MNRRITIIIAAGVVAIAAAAGVACSDDDAPTLEAYFAEVQALAKKSEDNANAALDSIDDQSTPQELRDALKELAGSLEDTSDEFDDIDPAEKAKTQHKALGEALDDWASASTDAAKSLDDLGDDATGDDVFNAFNTEEFTTTQEAFNNACKALEQVAADNNIEADLNCEDEEDEVAAAEQLIRDIADAWNAGDAQTLADHFTDAGLQSAFGEADASREEIIASIEENIGDGKIEIKELEAELTDEGADATVLWVSGAVYEHFTFALTMDDDGDWFIDGQEDLPVDVPAGHATIDIGMSEFAFTGDTASLTADGKFALKARNTGTQQHHLIFVKIPADANLEELLASEDDPPGVEFISGMEPIDPGADKTLVFGAPLEPGRYVFACFLPDTADAAGTPHAMKGMVADFRID